MFSIIIFGFRPYQIFRLIYIFVKLFFPEKHLSPYDCAYLLTLYIMWHADCAYMLMRRADCIIFFIFYFFKGTRGICVYFF